MYAGARRFDVSQTFVFGLQERVRRHGKLGGRVSGHVDGRQGEKLSDVRVADRGRAQMRSPGGYGG